MPHFANTPETLLGRNDSLNPATTCKGITSSGRPCRRALASPRKLPKPRLSRARSGLVAVSEEDGQVQEVDFYCWQHKEQAEERKAHQDLEEAGGRRIRRKTSIELYPLQERSSIDTLFQKLGIEETRKPDRSSRKKRDKFYRPQASDTQDFADQALRKPDSALPPKRAAPKKKQGFWASLCCATSEDDGNYVEVVRHRRRVEQTQAHAGVGKAEAKHSPNASHSAPLKPVRPSKDSGERTASQQQVSSNPQTNRLLSIVPQHLSPQTTSALFAELTKPISATDEEGYIYIFWLTPDSQESPEESTSRSLLSPGRANNVRRISDVMSKYSISKFTDATAAPNSEKTITLKIGRASNITRRMNEWQRQCGYALNLVRWYPYIPSTPTPSPRQSRSSTPSHARSPSSSRRDSDAVRKVPYVKRVERLIHLELAERQVKKQCEACGKEHREWFEVEASQNGVKGVDETVKRWVEWAEKEAAG